MKKSDGKNLPVNRIRVWDLGVRVGHWSLAVAFAIAFLEYRTFPLHAYVGYAILAIVVWRIVWGFIGPEHARFRAFLYSPRDTLRYTLSALRLGPAAEYLSHNPMGALMVFALLAGLLAECVLGMMFYSANALSGPLGELVPTPWEDWLESAHSLLGNVLAWMIAGHLIGIAWATWWHRENYVLPMITGFKSRHHRRQQRRGPERRRP